MTFGDEIVRLIEDGTWPVEGIVTKARATLGGDQARTLGLVGHLAARAKDWIGDSGDEVGQTDPARSGAERRTSGWR